MKELIELKYKKYDNLLFIRLRAYLESVVIQYCISAKKVSYHIFEI